MPLRLLLAVLATLLAGCSAEQGAPQTAPVTSSTPAPAPSATSASPTPPSSPTPRPSPTAVATPVDPLSPLPALESAPPPGLPTCRAAALTVTDADTLVFPQWVHEVFVLRTSGPSCQLQGFPSVRLVGDDGPLPVTVGRGGFGLPSERAAVVTLSKDTSLSFVVAVARDGSCADATAVEAVLPGASSPRRVATVLRVCGTTAGVSPVRRATDDE